MTHTPLPNDDIERQLSAGERYSLRPDERSDMKASLLAHANWHGQKAVIPEPGRQQFFSRFHLPAIGLAVLMVSIISGTGATAYQSLPGELLYPVKVDYVEPLVMAFQYPDLNPVAEQTVLMKRRLDEVKLLAAANELTPEASDIITDSLEEYSDSIVDTLAAEKETSGSLPTHSLSDLDTAAALIDAHSFLLSSSSDADAKASLDESETALETASVDHVEWLTKGTASTSVTTYIDSTLDDINDRFTDSQYSSSTLDEVKDHIENASDSLAEHAVPEAQDAISRAHQLLLTEEYLADATEETPPLE
jgi:hypothetical protein